MLALMNYRHSYHAGNFADVLKHAVFALVLEYMKRKEAPFRVIDTHAGAGRYALTSPEAQKTGEWQSGIARLLGLDAASLAPDPARHLQPYLDAVRRENPSGSLNVYPGSPAIALNLMRSQDTLVANELHPEDRSLLAGAIGGDRRVKLMALDAWVALKALLPPKERRGVVLIDPPFEEKDELERMTVGLEQGLRRFATGIYIVWYPIKTTKPITDFHATLVARGLPRSLRIELMREHPRDPDRLNGCGLLVVNPPFTLESEVAAILPELSRRLSAPGGRPSYRLDWLDRARVTGDVALSPKRRTRPT